MVQGGDGGMTLSITLTGPAEELLRLQCRSDESLLLKAEAEQARTERIAKLKADCPYIGEQVARWAGIWASSGKPHASAMRAIGYMLGLDGLDCIKDDDESGEHRFT